MKKNKLNMTMAITLAATLCFSSCIGSFSLTNKVLSWNGGVGNKFVNELVFIAFHIIPVYEATVFVDLIVLNSVEFWTGSSPIAQESTKEVKGENGDIYLVNNRFRIRQQRQLLVSLGQRRNDQIHDLRR